jgi:hypothetical protein
VLRLEGGNGGRHCSAWACGAPPIRDALDDLDGRSFCRFHSDGPLRSMRAWLDTPAADGHEAGDSFDADRAGWFRIGRGL